MQRQYYFIGIGGIGMGTLASLVRDQGNRVSGSDLRENGMTQALRQKGIDVHIGHAAESVGRPDYVVYSSAVSEVNPEMQYSRQAGLTLLRRGELLARLMQDYKAIAVAGAHGKTTTSSMIAHMMIKTGLHPTTAVGGITGETSYNAVLGTSRYFVAEVDESDGSFLFCRPDYAVITNIDLEHVDHYGCWENICQAYTKFISGMTAEGMLVVCGDDQRLRPILQSAGRQFITYGLGGQNMLRAEDVRVGHFPDYRIQYRCRLVGRDLGEITLRIPGHHNILNSLACVAMGLLLNIDFAAIQDSLMSYRSVNRRFQLVGTVGDVMVVDDYGHHPTEVRATLQAARSLQPRRLITVFQPHRYSRTKFLMDDFVKALGASDVLIITDVYAACEEEIAGVSGEILAERIRAAGHRDCVYFSKEGIVPHLQQTVQKGDLVLTLGAGDICQISGQFIAAYGGRLPVDLNPVAREDDERPEGLIVGVLKGGCSSERNISLKSGEAIETALRQSGLVVKGMDIQTTEPAAVKQLLKDSGVDVVFLALHGSFGEDGTVQQLCEQVNMPYTGSGPQASALAMNKALTQDRLREHRITVPAFEVLTGVTETAVQEGRFPCPGLPVVVKPVQEGSSIGITIVRSAQEWEPALRAAARCGDCLLVEAYISGREITAGVLDGRPLPLVEIHSGNTFFDFEAKYQKGRTRYSVPAALPDEESGRLQKIAGDVYHVLGCRDMARVDFILAPDGMPFVLEVNTIPGFTETSLLPMAARAAGYTFPQVCRAIVEMAWARKQQPAMPS